MNKGKLCSGRATKRPVLLGMLSGNTVLTRKFREWVIVNRDAGLIGARVQLITGSRVGTVIDTAHVASGNVSVLPVKLDSDKIIWIDAGDVRCADGIVMTSLDQADLRHMADERV